MATRRERALPAQMEAYVLHSHDWSESSLIVELFTRERGRLAVVAKGAKRPTSQLRAILLPFQRVQVTLGRAPADASAELHVLRQAEWAGGGALMPAASLFRGFYLNEVVMKLLQRQDPHPGLYDAYDATLPALAASSELHARAALRAFEWIGLREAGVLPDLSRATVSHQAVDPAQRYELRPRIGLVVSGSGESAGGFLTGAQLMALQHALDAQDLAALHLACLDNPNAQRVMLREWLDYHLGSTPWRTRSVMHSVQRLIDSVS